MSQGGPLVGYNLRLTPEREQLVYLNAFPIPVGVIACASATVPVSNSTTATTATYTTAIPFSLYAGMCVHLQCDAPMFLGDGPTSAIAIANATARAKRIDAWEPWTPLLGMFPNDYPAYGTVTMNRDANNQLAWFVAVVLQSAGAGALFVGRMK